MKKEHTNLMAIISKRESNMSLVLKYWTQGDTLTAFNSLTMMNDCSVIMDVFNTTFAVGQRIDVLTLDHVTPVLSLSLVLLKSKYDCYIQTGLKTIHQMFQIFGDVFFFSFYDHIYRKLCLQETCPLEVELILKEKKD